MPKNNFKYKMCSDGLKQLFPNFLFSRRAIFYLFFFPEIKAKIQSFSFVLPLYYLYLEIALECLNRIFPECLNRMFPK